MVGSLKISAAQARGLEEIRARLRAVDECASSVLDWVTGQMHQLLGVDAAGVYALEDSVAGPRIGFGVWAGLRGTHVNKHLSAGLERIGPFAAYDALRPSVQQRNRLIAFPSPRRIMDATDINVRVLRAEERREAIERVRQHYKTFSNIGVLDLKQHRILICDGPRLLAWLGVLDSQDCNAQRRQLLELLASMVRPRLRFERERQNAGVAFAALDASLEAIGAPALVISAQGSVVHANSVGQHVLDQSRERVAALISRVSDGVTEGADVYDLGARGQPGARLVILRSKAFGASMRQRAAVSLWKLTPREAQVLELLILGDTNRDIGTTLGCAEATVEIHVSRLLRKARVETRTALVSAFWNTGAAD